MLKQKVMVMDNPLTYLVGLTALDWQPVALLALLMFSQLVVYRRHLSPKAIFNRRQGAGREQRQQGYGLRRSRRLR